MKSLLITIMIACSIEVFADNKIISLDEYMDNHDIYNDKKSKYHLALRCTAVFSYTAEFIESLKDQFIISSEIWLLVAKIESIDLENFKYDGKIHDAITKLINIYIAIGKESFSTQGSYLTDLHVSDINTCINLLKKIP